MDANSIHIQNAQVVRAGKEILHDISVDLPAGKIIGFIGPSGAGKTTLIRAIVGRQRLSGGTITVGTLPAGSPDLRKRMSYMTQAVSIYEDLTVGENLQYFATMRGIAKPQLKQTIAQTIEAVDIAPQLHQIAGSLSGGQKQRLSLAIALLGDPDFLVLDEPTVGLDPVLREQLWHLFDELSGRGKTLIISSHVMDEASRCGELLLIREGRILAYNSPQKLCEKTGSQDIEASFLKLVRQKT